MLIELSCIYPTILGVEESNNNPAFLWKDFFAVQHFGLPNYDMNVQEEVNI